MQRAATAAAAAGFTLIELITVVALIGILVGIALPNYRAAIIQSREAVLSENLFRLRDVIDQYYADKGKYPASLEALVDDGYLRTSSQGPDHPGAATGSRCRRSPTPTGPASQAAGVVDVKSASEGISLAGTPYNEW